MYGQAAKPQVDARRRNEATNFKDTKLGNEKSTRERNENFPERKTSAVRPALKYEANSQLKSSKRQV